MVEKIEYKVNIANIEIRCGRITKSAIIHDSFVNTDNEILYFVTDKNYFANPFWVTKKITDSVGIKFDQGWY